MAGMGQRPTMKQTNGWEVTKSKQKSGSLWWRLIVLTYSVGPEERQHRQGRDRVKKARDLRKLGEERCFFQVLSGATVGPAGAAERGHSALTSSMSLPISLTPRLLLVFLSAQALSRGAWGWFWRVPTAKECTLVNSDQGSQRKPLCVSAPQAYPARA